MAKCLTALIIGYFLSIGCPSFGQTWKQYFDSAAQISGQNKFTQATDLYLKSKDALPVDSARSATYAGICDSLGICYTNSHSYQLAEKYFLEAKGIQEKKLGKGHLDYLFSFSSLGILYRNMELYEKSLLILITVRDRWHKLTGRKSIPYGEACYQLGYLYIALKNFPFAEKLLLESRQVQLENTGAESREYALSCLALGEAYTGLKQYEQAKTLYLEAKDILQKLYGSNHPEYGSCCIGLAKLYQEMGENEKAERFFLEGRDVHQANPGIHSKEYASAINTLGNFYLKRKLYKKAEALYLEVKYLRDSIFGRMSKQYADVCQNLGRSYYYNGQPLKALAQYLEVKEVREKVFGNESEMYASACADAGTVYLMLGQSEKAEVLYSEAREIYYKLFGKKRDYATTCKSLAMAYTTQKEFDKAEPMMKEAIRIMEKISGKDHFDYGNTAYSISMMYLNSGQYKKAEGYGIDAMRLYAKEKDNDFAITNYPNVLINLANIYKRMSMYDLAEPLYLEAKAIHENNPAASQLYMAFLWNELAEMYRLTGDFEKAEPLLLKAKPVLSMLGKQHPDYLMCLDNLGTLYMVMGQFDKAEIYYVEAKNTREKMYGKKHSNYIISCNNLVTLYQVSGQRGKALSMVDESSIEDQRHPNYTVSLRNKAKVYKDLLQYDKAKKLLEEALRIQKEQGRTLTEDYAFTCNSLAAVYFYTGRFKEAESLFQEGKKLYKKFMGAGHLDYGAFCTNLGGVYWALQQPDLAEEQFRESFTVKERALRSIFDFTTEKEKEAFKKNIAGEDNDIYSFYLSNQFPSEHPYSLALFHRNLILSSSQSLRKEIFASGDSTVISKYNEWTRLKKYLAVLHAKPAAERAREVDEVEQKAIALEKELAKRSVSFVKNSQISGWKDIRNTLKKDEAAIEFITFDYASTFGPRDSNSTYYAAILLRKDTRYPEMIGLFKAQQLDSLLIAGEDKTGNSAIKNLYASRGVIVKGRRAETRSVYDLAWKPLEPALNGIQTIYYSPSGMLHRIAFAALPVDSNTVLSDRYKLVQLASTGGLPDQQEVVISKEDKLQLYGGIQYDADTSLLKKAAGTYHAEGNNVSRSVPLDPSRGGSFQYLPGTSREIEEIRSASERSGISVRSFSGITATEESFKQLESGSPPSILHIATHSFFFPDPSQEKPGKADSLQRDAGANEHVFHQSDNPLFRSGLLFAGANNAWQGKAADGIEDGILTAYEVSNMYLPKTKLVVLSACETALGDIQGNEGVYGLQRAFKIAGVQNLLMSLWKVPDAETAEFMELFYRNLFSGQTITDAFQHTQSSMKDKYRNQPYKWAAWILVR